MMDRNPTAKSIFFVNAFISLDEFHWKVEG